MDDRHAEVAKIDGHFPDARATPGCARGSHGPPVLGAAAPDAAWLAAAVGRAATAEGPEDGTEGRQG